MLGRVFQAFLCALAAAAVSAPIASADVFNMPAGQTSLQFVTVGNPGNAPDSTGYGSVPYTYQMGEFDVTTAQYAQFLNDVAASDPYGLYNPSMNYESAFGTCGISRSGAEGDYTYTVQPGRGSLPVNEVTWGDAARFCNWLDNGQPDTGLENATTTEDGSYSLNGAVTDQQLDAVTRSQDAIYVIPTENEWYKAAYYKGGSSNAGYWLYPTKSDSAPSNVLSATGTDNANFDDPVLGLTDTVNGETQVGAFADSPGPYGTYDMGGDASQWTEGFDNDMRVIRGGSFSAPVNYLASDTRLADEPSDYEAETGFRVALVPEPGSLTIAGVVFFCLLRRHRPA